MEPPDVKGTRDKGITRPYIGDEPARVYSEDITGRSSNHGMY